MRNADRVEIEDIVVRLGEPQQGFVSARKPLVRMETEIESPDDPVPQLEPVTDEHAVKMVVERNHLAVTYEITDLPADTAAIRDLGAYLLDDRRQPSDISSSDIALSRS